jgi:long-chain acyl-CoA synthetase
MLSVLLGGDRNISPVSKVKMVFYGGGELMPGVAERSKEIFGVEPLEGYGLTEASSVLAVTPGEDKIKFGASGKILSCFEAEVRGEGGELLPFDSEGRLWIRGDALANGYYRAPELSSERFKDGWFDTQDIVKIDEGGYITIVSPSVDVIVVEGKPVYPQEVEGVLKGHPEISEVAVIGIPRRRNDEIVKAFVVLKEGGGAKPRDIVMYGKMNLPNYKAPRSVRILAELPKDNLGKVMKKELRGV